MDRRTDGRREVGAVDLRAGLDDVEKRKFLILPGLDIQPLGLPARGQSLYRLRYPGSIFLKCTSKSSG
jgi:hypothetical protein